MKWLTALLRRLIDPPKDCLTTDGQRLCPYPEMTDEDLFDFERDMKVPNPTWATFEDFAKDQLKLGLRSGFVRGNEKHVDDPLELLASKTVARNLAGHTLPETPRPQPCALCLKAVPGVGLKQSNFGLVHVMCWEQKVGCTIPPAAMPAKRQHTWVGYNERCTVCGSLDFSSECKSPNGRVAFQSLTPVKSEPYMPAALKTLRSPQIPSVPEGIAGRGEFPAWSDGWYAGWVAAGGEDFLKREVL